MRIKLNDIVKVVAGKDKGKEGKVIQIFPKMNKVVVDGVNAMTKHLKARKRDEKGQKVTFFGPIHVSNVQLLCPKTKKPTRVSMAVLKDGQKVRVSKKSGEQIA